MPKKKHKLISSEPEFMRLERALFHFNDVAGWKSLTAFLVKWTNVNQPSDTSYTLKSWLNVK